MKRKADTEEDGDYSPAKRSRDGSHPPAVLCPENTVGDDGSVFDPDPANSDQDDLSIDHAQTPLTSLSGASPAHKFPSDLKTIKCTWPDCPKTFNRPARLKAHLRSHTNERPFKCSQCDKSYMEEKHLKQHIKGSHTLERAYTCTEPGCGKSFLTSTRLRRHHLVHEGQERFRCRAYPPCNQTFRKHQTLQRHIRSEHLKMAAFACTEKSPMTNEPCTAAFDSASALKRHVERDHGELRYWCEECDSENGEREQRGRIGFPTAELLQKHMQKAHIRCMFCERVFPARDELEAHIEDQHAKGTVNERKSVQCTWPGCTRTFVKRWNMTVHLRSVHEGLRFVCGEVDLSGTQDLGSWPQTEGCGHGFVTKGNLEDHVRYVHLGMQRPKPKLILRPADIVGELSGISENARHTIPCPVQGCTIKFPQQEDLQIHLQSQHVQTSGALDQIESEILNMALGQRQGSPMVSDQSMAEVSAPLATTTTDNVSLFYNAMSPLTPGTIIPDQYWFGNDGSQFVGAVDPEWRDPMSAAIDQQWLQDEAEMRQLIGQPGELEGLIDPNLMQ